MKDVKEVKKWIALVLILGVLGFIGFMIGCGATTTGTSTTSTTIAASSAVAISGTTAVGVTSLGLKTSSTALGTAEVSIGYCTSGSDTVTELARGTTSSDGTYEVLVSTDALKDLKASSGRVPNLMVTISKEGEIIGCVIPSVSPEAGSRGYAPTASKGDYKKALIARSAFKKGEDPKSFDYSGSIDTKFSSESLKEYDASKIDAVADSIKSAEDAESSIGEALGISAADMNSMRQKGFELHQTYIEPIMRAAFEAKTPPSRDQMDAAFASMEAAMTKYARDTLGISDQAIADFKSMKDKQFETKMGEESALTGDAALTESKLRMAGDKMISMFLGQWDAANTLATIAPSGKVTFAVSNEATYTSFTASKESIKAHLLDLQSTAGTDPGVVPTYLRTNFFDAFIFPPPTTSKGTNEAAMNDYMSQYVSSRILIYFMRVFLAQTDQETFFRTTQPAMQAIFERRFQLHRIDPQTGTQEATAAYYMGPTFWATVPSPSAETIQTRLDAFNTALTAAIDNSTTRAIIKTHAGFTDSQTNTILTAFRMLMAPPGVM